MPDSDNAADSPRLDRLEALAREGATVKLRVDASGRIILRTPYIRLTAPDLRAAIDKLQK